MTGVDAVMPDGTLSSCNTVAATFDNTCPVGQALSSLSGHQGEEMRCVGDMRCPGTTGSQTYTESNPCIYYRKLCVSCSESEGTVKVKVQSNGLPNHCYNSTVNIAEAKETEWQAVWNANMNGI